MKCDGLSIEAGVGDWVANHEINPWRALDNTLKLINPASHRLTD
jgi:hypothetical protein